MLDGVSGSSVATLCIYYRLYWEGIVGLKISCNASADATSDFNLILSYSSELAGGILYVAYLLIKNIDKYTISHVDK